MFKVSIQLSATEVKTVDFPSPLTLIDAILKRQWCPGTFKSRQELIEAGELKEGESNRKNKFFIEAHSIFAIDIDNTYKSTDTGYPELKWQQAAQRLNELGLQYIIGSSKNHNKIKKGYEAAGPVDRYRILVFLDQPILTNTDYKKVFLYASTIFPELDEQCSDPARYFDPCKEILVSQFIGRKLGVSEAIQSVPQKAVAIRQSAKREAVGPKKRRPQYVNDYMVDGPGEQGGRNNLMFKVCQWFAKERQLSPEEIFNEVWPKAEQAGLTEEEVMASCVSAQKTEVEFTLPINANAEFHNRLISGQLVVNLKDKSQNTILYNEDTGEKISFDFASVTQVFSREIIGMLRSRMILANFVYDPFKKSGLTFGGFNTFNTYSHPEWRAASSRPSASATNGGLPGIPDLYRKFIFHLVKEDESSYEYVLDWLATALTSRNFTVLCAICAEEGTGKGTLGSVACRLVGEDNFNKVRDEVFKNKFNAGLANKRFIQLDEVKLKNEEELNRFKDIVNESIEIEKKGVDAEVVRNYASFYLTSNNIDAVRPSASDRRFSIVEMTEIKLLAAFSKEDVDKLYSGYQLAEFGQALLVREVKNDMTKPFKSKQYENVKEASLSRWQEYLLEDFAQEFLNKQVELRRVQELIRENNGLNLNVGRIKLKKFCDDNKQFLEFKTYKGKRYISPIKAKYGDEFEEASLPAPRPTLESKLEKLKMN